MRVVWWLVRRLWRVNLPVPTSLPTPTPTLREPERAAEGVTREPIRRKPCQATDEPAAAAAAAG
jgi:hypothetical protein